MKNKDANRERLKIEKSAERVNPISSNTRARANQRVRVLDPEDYEDEDFAIFEKFHRSR